MVNAYIMYIVLQSHYTVKITNLQINNNEIIIHDTKKIYLVFFYYIFIVSNYGKKAILKSNVWGQSNENMCLNTCMNAYIYLCCYVSFSSMNIVKYVHIFCLPVLYIFKSQIIMYMYQCFYSILCNFKTKHLMKVLCEYDVKQICLLVNVVLISTTHINSKLNNG